MIELAFKKDPKGLLPAIVQDAASGEVLMLAYINQLAWEKTSGNRQGPLLEPFEKQPLVEGRKFRPCPADQGNTGGLRSGYGGL